MVSDGLTLTTTLLPLGVIMVIWMLLSIEVVPSIVVVELLG